MMRVSRVASTSVLMLLLGRPVRPAQEQLDTDGELADFLRADLAHLDIRGLEIRVVGGMATLEGEVDSLASRRDAEATARLRHGIHLVSDELRVVKVPDEDLLREVQVGLEKSRHYTIYDDVVPSVSGGLIFLTGRVPQDSALDEMVNDLSRIRGVSAIENDVRILPYSPADEKLQEAVAVDVYADLSSRGFGTISIHVIVEGAKATLTGIVADEATRKAAEEAARRTAGVREVENRLQVGVPGSPLIPRAERSGSLERSSRDRSGP